MINWEEEQLDLPELRKLLDQMPRQPDSFDASNWRFQSLAEIRRLALGSYVVVSDLADDPSYLAGRQLGQIVRVKAVTRDRIELECVDGTVFFRGLWIGASAKLHRDAPGKLRFDGDRPRVHLDELTFLDPNGSTDDWLAVIEACQDRRSELFQLNRAERRRLDDLAREEVVSRHEQWLADPGDCPGESAGCLQRVGWNDEYECQGKLCESCEALSEAKTLLNIEVSAVRDAVLTPILHPYADVTGRDRYFTITPSDRPPSSGIHCRVSWDPYVGVHIVQKGRRRMLWSLRDEFKLVDVDGKVIVSNELLRELNPAVFSINLDDPFELTSGQQLELENALSSGFHGPHPGLRRALNTAWAWSVYRDDPDLGTAALSLAAEVSLPLGEFREIVHYTLGRDYPELAEVSPPARRVTTFAR
jgi:hypothetical protein